MADKTQNININYKFNTAEIEKAAQSLAKANQASNKLQQEAGKTGQAGAKGVQDWSKSIAGLESQMQRLAFRAKNATNPADAKRYADQWQQVKKQIEEATKAAGGFNKATATTNQQLAGMLTSFKGLSKLAGLAIFATLAKEAVEFSLAMSTLQGQVEGVERGFKRAFTANIGTLDKLREATHGTISDFELMQRSLQATNLGVSMEHLPVLFEFAAARAQQTGESVDYLVDSIVRGIGRKSPLVLDNLGISVTALREKFNGASIASKSVAEATEGVAAIAKEQLALMGGYADTAETEVKQLGAAWDNFKVQFAKRLETSWLTEMLTRLADGARILLLTEDQLREARIQQNAEWDAETTIKKKLNKDLIKDEQELTTAFSVEINKRIGFRKKSLVDIAIEEEKYRKLQEKIRKAGEGKFISQKESKDFEVEEENILKRVRALKEYTDQEKIVIELLMQASGIRDKTRKDYETLEKLRARQAELERVRNEDINTAHTREYENNKRAILILQDRILKIDNVIEWEKKWMEPKEAQAQVLKNEADNLAKINNEFDDWMKNLEKAEGMKSVSDIWFEGRDPKATEDVGEINAFEAESLDPFSGAEQDARNKVDESMGRHGEAFGLSGWRTFWTRFRLGMKREGGASSELQQDFQDALQELELGGIDIFADQLKSKASMEAESYDARIKQAKQFFDEQQAIAGNNEKAKDLLRIIEDRKIRELRTRQFIAEQKAAKQRALIDAASAAVKVFVTAPNFYVALAQAALIAAQAASQIAIIDRQQPKFAKGVIDLQGPGTSTSDSIPARLSKHESVMTAWETQNAGGILKEIRAKKLDDRVLKSLREGRQPVPVGMSDQGIIKAIRDIKQPDVILQSGIVYKATKKSDDYISKQRAKSIRI